MAIKVIGVTGSRGFLGREIVAELELVSNTKIRKIVRSPSTGDEGAICVGSLSSATDFRKALDGVDVIVHAAAVSASTKSPSTFELSEIQEVNVEATLNLATTARDLGVKRFVFISSVKVLGESTSGSSSFSMNSAANPEDDYAKSKWRAECGLREIFSGTDTELVIVRPPLIYGPGVSGNFLKLLRIADTGIPLPFRGVNNNRSFVYVSNLAKFVRECCLSEKVLNEVFLISDFDDMSTVELFSLMRKCMNRPARLFGFPPRVIGFFLRLCGYDALFDRLFGSLTVDPSHSTVVLDYRPVTSSEKAVQATVDGYMKKKESHV